ncbi:BgTH12-03065 [Blumeria graminis f. sp. triticale]|uniref:BgtASP-20735 n=3 Tax=Blumeria graminis TaxID=34373 RepID=A0A9X9MJY2_BLUGR|nr:hypothetical protein BGT96224_ASP20735 [Blumeria graminis f. sp. tritici 96224]CAD6503400.1 BgTH12-03065 [Blumeria graminis f. sp. triticale]VDB89487.1 BgtASP-20735 [Blumeria graminis f. sp. tritici]
MATIKQRLALSFINFLTTSLADGTLSEEDRESVEVAQTCISDIFKVESTESAPKDSESLLQIYSVYEKLKSKTPNNASKDTATPITTSTPSDDKKKEAEKLKSQGNTSMANKEYDTAIDQYTKALALVPGNPIFLSNRAAAYSASKDHEAARADAEAAVAADPTYTKAWSRLGFARFALGDAKGSKEAYAKGIEYEGNGGSEAMKKGFETASKRVADLEIDEKTEADDTVTDRGNSNVGSGGMPDLSSLAGMFGRGGGGGGMPDLSSIMSNPMFASMAQNLMSNPEMLGNLMNNPRLAELAGQMSGGGGSGGTPDLSSILQDPNIAEMAKKFMGGAGRGN